MIDMQASLEKLRTDAAEAALIRDLATDSVKRVVRQIIGPSGNARQRG